MGAVSFVDPNAADEETSDQRKYPKLRRTVERFLASMCCLRLTLAVQNSGILKDSACYPDSVSSRRNLLSLDGTPVLPYLRMCNETEETNKVSNKLTVAY